MEDLLSGKRHAVLSAEDRRIIEDHLKSRKRDLREYKRIANRGKDKYADVGFPAGPMSPVRGDSLIVHKVHMEKEISKFGRDPSTFARYLRDIKRP